APVLPADTPFFGALLFEKDKDGFAFVVENSFFGVIKDPFFYRENIYAGTLVVKKPDKADQRAAPLTDEISAAQTYARAMVELTRQFYLTNTFSENWKKAALEK
ncbi:MAG: hypothetical protein PHW69_01255, partial [Elusimicrobiaceae bacterium]|nr:hypothetical protein [Elusimicrobiaceae bacterium]